MRFASLGSGSEGNALVVECGKTRVLLDCGFGPRELRLRLARLNLVPENLDAVLITHEHNDHIGGAPAVTRRFGLPVRLSYGTLCGATRGFAEGTDVGVIDSHQPFAIGDLEIRPFPVPHDAREPTHFVFSDGAHRLGVLTDAGSVTPHMLEMLSALDALVLECNHDSDMLANGRYPQPLKTRIAGRLGHLSNTIAAELLAGVAGDRLQHIVAAHLSRENNTPELAQCALAGALGCADDWIGVATQDAGFDWRQIA
jgi:phosphoribosyl 1,2-cyclic phosphodiesterase